jgi:hypothetical protein
VIETKAVFNSERFDQTSLYVEYTSIQETQFTILEHQSEESLYYGNFLLHISLITLIILENNLYKSLMSYIHQKNVIWAQKDNETLSHLVAAREE